MTSLIDSIQAVIAGISAQIAHLWNLTIHSGFPLLFWIQPRWSVDKMTDQSGKIILITGANSGTGFASAWALYEAGAKVYMACRSEEKARKAIEYIQSHRWKKEGKGELVFLQMDLSDLKSVKRATEEYREKEQILDVLMCNAGIMATAEGQYTAQDYTLQFGTNVIGHQALISHLLPTLLATTRKNPSSPARVLTLSSAGHAAAPKGGVDYRSVVRAPGAKDGQKGPYEVAKWAEYGQAKWGDIALARYLHLTYGPGSKDELLCFSMHPGMVATNLASHLGGADFAKKYLSFLAMFVVRFPDVGAGNQLWLATMPTAQARKLAGEYIVPFQSIGRPRPDVMVEANVVRMWDWCEREVKKHI